MDIERSNVEAILKRLLEYSDESEIVEFKEAKNQFDGNKLGKYFSALSNEASLTSRSAWLVFGIKDDKAAVGTSCYTTVEQKNKIKRFIAEHSTSQLTFKRVVETRLDGKRVVLLEIPQAPPGIPVAWKGHYYGRDGSSLGALNIEEIERIRRRENMDDWSARIVPEATVEDLDAKALVLARKRYVQKNPRLEPEVSLWDDVTFLNKARLAIRGELTHAALLLLGSAESAVFLNPASGRISWILKDAAGQVRDYEHFGPPLLSAVDRVFQKIRNLKYRYIKDGTLFPEEVEQYDPFVIREALHNAIAHQDYVQGGHVSVVEFEGERLCFANPGFFIPGSVEGVLRANAPESRYRNRFLVEAMVNMNMIDTIGSGIRRMYRIQSERFFPLPEYDLGDDAVTVEISGRILDMNYARKLAQVPDLSLDDIILLDRVQKKKPIDSASAKYLRAKNLIEGRKPNYHISAKIAAHGGDRGDYVKMRPLDDEHYKWLIIEFINSFGSAKRRDIEGMLQDKLPDILSQDQKQNKVRNLLQVLRRDGVIHADGKTWMLPKDTSSKGYSSSPPKKSEGE